MPRFLVTRPISSAQNLCPKLVQRGYEVIIDPLLTIEPTRAPRPAGPKPDAVMFTSSNAFRVKPLLEDLVHLPCYCVGPNTAEAAYANGFTDLIVGEANVMDLASRVASRMETGKRIWHIGGTYYKESGAEFLNEHGFEVSFWSVYEAKAAEAFSAETVAALAEGHLDGVLFFSPRTARVFRTLLDNADLEVCCERLIAVGLSESVAEEMDALPWKDVTIAPTPKEDSIIEALVAACPLS